MSELNFKRPAFSREGWKQIAASEYELRSGEARSGEADLVSREELLAMMDGDADAE